MEPDSLANDAALLMKLLKRAQAAFETVANPNSDAGQSSGVLMRIAHQSRLLLGLAKLPRPSEPLPQPIEKLKIRLREWLVASRGRASTGSTGKELRGFLQQLEVAVGLFDRTGNLGQLAGRIYSLIVEHLRSCKIRFDLLRQCTPQIQMKPKVRRAHSLGVEGGGENGMCSLYGLEVENGHLKGLIISWRRSQMEAMQGQLERNKTAQKQIDIFTREHHMHATRHRKHKSELPKKRSTRNLRVKTHHQQIGHNFHPIRKRPGHSKENSLEIIQAPIRPSCKLNNVYVSGNEFDIYAEPHSQMPRTQFGKKGSVFLTRAMRDPLMVRPGNGMSRQIFPM